MPEPLRWTDAAFPGRAALDVGVSRALLRDVALGRAPETLRLYTPDAVLAFSSTDLRRPGFGAALAAARRAGFEATLRLAGGSAAVFHERTLAFAWCSAEPLPRDGIRERFERIAGWVARALAGLGVDARVGAVPGEYCPGDWSVNAAGRRKLMGVGQRIVRGGAHVGGVIVVGERERTSRVLADVYRALELDYDERATGCVEDEIGPTPLARVRDALLAEIAKERELVRAPLDAGTLAGAARFEDSHRLAPAGA